MELYIYLKRYKISERKIENKIIKEVETKNKYLIKRILSDFKKKLTPFILF